VLRAAEIAGVSAVVFVRGKQPYERAIELARVLDLPVMLTWHSLYDTCGRRVGGRGIDTRCCDCLRI